MGFFAIQNPPTEGRSQNSGGKNKNKIRKKLDFCTLSPLQKAEFRRQKSQKQKKDKEKGWFSAPRYWLVEMGKLEIGKREVER